MSTGKKIKLLVFIPTLECGGSERYISLLCDHIDSNRFDVTLVVLNNAHPFYELSNNITELIDLRVKRVRHAMFRIKKLIKRKQPDIIYTVANHLNLLFAMGRRMLPSNLKIVARESSIVSINSNHAQFPSVYKELLKRFYRQLDLIICQSAYMQQDLIKNFNIPGNKTVIIHNPVGELRIAEEDANAGTSSPKKYKLVTVGRLSKEKGIDRLIRAVAIQSQSFQYYIIGEGTERASLQALIDSLQLNDKVFLEGEKLNPWLHMEGADLFLMGSHYEGFPNALIEAGSLGIPVVAFDSPGGISEIIKDGENGILVKSNDEADFAVAIEKALVMNFDRNKIIANTKERYALDKIIRLTEELFEKLHSA